MKRVWIAEKPSFAKELGKALGNCKPLERWAWSCNGGIIVSAAGHLVELAEPHDYNEDWKNWNVASLPMIPEGWNFMYKPIEGKTAQLKVIEKYAKDADELIIATDAGREGEYIAWTILQYLGLSKKPKRRLWSSGANVKSIEKAARDSALLKYSDKYLLSQSARIRAESDWVEGLNLTRLITKRFKPNGLDGPVTVGRVQTATLAIIVERKREIDSFVSEKYYDIIADVKAGPHIIRLYHNTNENNRISDAGKARLIIEKANNAIAILDVKNEQKKERPPTLFESSSLQIRAYNLWGWSATKTEEISQALYDKHKLISYPRTDGVHLEDEQWQDARQILTNISTFENTDKINIKGNQNFPEFSKYVPDYDKLTPRDTVFNSKLLEKSGADHHGIIPTTEYPDFSNLSDNEVKLYLLIVRQFLAQLLPDCEYIQKSISWDLEGRKFSTAGRVILKQGWKILFNTNDDQADNLENDVKEEDMINDALPDIDNGTRSIVQKTYLVEKKTIAPALFTEGSIISAMSDLTKIVKDPKDLEKVKIAKVIGTKSTWGETIKKLKDRHYITSAKGKLTPTHLGNDLYDLCKKYVPSLVHPTSTAILEFMLMHVEKGECETSVARKKLQTRNIDVIMKCLDIGEEKLRLPENYTPKNDYSNNVFKDFEGGSWVVDISFELKEEAKSLGGKFNSQTKKWHIPKDKISHEELVKKAWIK